MAEVKNAFIKSKMNLDLDARLVPQGEYRQGTNIQVSKSEGDDVGALENVLGNKLIENGNFASLTQVSNIQVIGQYTDVNTDTIYIFLTDYTEPTPKTSITHNPNANNFIYSYNAITGDFTSLVTGPFLNFSTTNPIYGINTVENLLFFTDNRNQPRKINVSLANPNRLTSPTYYYNEDQISVAKYAPYQAINLYKPSTISGVSGYETTMYDVVSTSLPNGASNPYLNTQYPGDPNFLEDKFVKFSYRFKYDDNEYSVLAPFTQAAFIPKQDGFFLPGDEEATFRSTVVDFMENKVNEILLQIPLPDTASNISTSLKILEIDIIYKESDNTSVQVLDTLHVNSQRYNALPTSVINGKNYIEYEYQATKPYKTLPESELIRVYDKVPVRALAQEISGNRVIYGNFQNKHTPPANLDYNVNVGKKSIFLIPDEDTPAGATSVIEYPNSTVKQNRNYQVGLVLSDRYGRSSTVILSSNQIQALSGSDLFDVSTVYHNYRTSTDGTQIPITSWPGDSIKVLFNSIIPNQKDFTLGTPGLYNGVINSPDYNPLGWYSYKIVVKQFEQEYYNVYLPGILDGPPAGATGLDDAATEVGFITLINDNVNKVPRDLAEVGPEQKQFRSSVQLFGRVTPQANNNPSYNEQFYPGTQSNTVITIAEEDDLFGTTTALSNIYDSKSNPLIGRTSQISSSPIGSLGNSTAYSFQLGVFETSPVESRLDIYYETSTSGTISELNVAINKGGSAAVQDFYNFTFALTEAMPIGSSATTVPFALLDPANNDTPLQGGTLNLVSVRNATEELQSGNTGSYFNLVKIDANTGTNPQAYDRWQLITQREFYYGPNSNENDVFFFEFSAPNALFAENQALQNIAPTIYKDSVSSPNLSSTISLEVGTTTINDSSNATDPTIYFQAQNGSIDTSNYKKNLLWEITSQPAGNLFSINPQTAVITVSGEANGPYALIIQVTDAGGLTATYSPTILFGEQSINNGFGKTDENVVSNSLFPEGGTSLAIYWTNDATNSTTGENLDRTVGSINNNALVLPTTLSDGTGSNGYLQQTSTVITDTKPQQIYYYNSNYNAIGSAAGSVTQSEGGLTKGTAYIKLDIALSSDTFEDYNISQATSKQVFGIFPMVLEYRDRAGAGYPNNWVTATDIEGNPIQFGSTQINSYDYYTTVNINNQSTLQNTGVLNNDAYSFNFNANGVASPSGTNTGATRNNSMQIQVDSFNSNNSNYLISNASKTFAFGQSQSYPTQSAKFGDYRLIVRYPWGLNGAGLTTDYIVPGYNQYPVNDWYGRSMFEYSIDWGDFYYPEYSNATYYAYRVSSVGANSAGLAGENTPFQTLYAREWMAKYVSQFYTEPTLTTKWSPGSSTDPYNASTAWYSYSPLDDTFNAQNGTEFSNFTNFNNSSYQQAYTNSNRRWVAFFDAQGKKRAGDAFPSITGGIAPFSQ